MVSFWDTNEASDFGQIGKEPTLYPFQEGRHRLSTSKMKPFGSASSFDVLKKAHRNMHVNTHVQYILYHLSI